MICVVINDNKLRLHVEEGSRDLLTGPPVHPPPFRCSELARRRAHHPRAWGRFRVRFGIRLVVGVQIVRSVNIVVTRRTMVAEQNFSAGPP